MRVHFIAAALFALTTTVEGTEPAPEYSSAIPHILHQSWRTRRAVPRGLMPAVRSWKRIQPQWERRFWSDADNRALCASHFPWLLREYDRLTGIQRADVSRYQYMHVFGGVYADLDVELLRPLRPLLRSQRRHNASVVLGQEPLAHAVLLEGKRRQVCNAVLASVPGHPFWLFVLRRVQQLVRGSGGTDPVASTGPRMLERALSDWQQEPRQAGDVIVVPPDGAASLMPPRVPWAPLHACVRPPAQADGGVWRPGRICAYERCTACACARSMPCPQSSTRRGIRCRPTPSASAARQRHRRARTHWASCGPPCARGYAASVSDPQ